MMYFYCNLDSLICKKQVDILVTVKKILNCGYEVCALIMALFSILHLIFSICTERQVHFPIKVNRSTQ